MKLLTFCLIFTSAIVSAQPATWERQYDRADRTDCAIDIIEIPGGDFVTCGFTWDTTMLWAIDGFIMRINSVGDTAWTKTVGSMGFGAGIDMLYSVLLNNNNELVLTGERFQNPYGRQLWFLRVDPADGSVISEKFIGGTLNDAGGKIIQTANGGYYIFGTTHSTPDTEANAWLLRLNANGDTLWTKQYDFGYEDNGSCIMPFQNNNYLITMYNCTHNCGQALQGGFSQCIVIDSLGNILKTLVFDTGPKNKLGSIAPTLDGGAIITGATSIRDSASGLGFMSEDLWMIKLDDNADTVWTKIYGSWGLWDGGTSVFQSNDGGYYVVGYTNSIPVPQMDYDNYWLLRMNSDGDTLWTRVWGGVDNDDPFSVKPTSDGGLIIAGWRDANSNIFLSLNIGNSDIYIIKTDTAGLVGIPGLPVSNDENVILFPNPSSGNFTLYLEEKTNNAQLMILDVCGKPLHQSKIISKKSEIFLSLPRGMYLYQVKDDRQIISSGKIAVQ